MSKIPNTPSNEALKYAKQFVSDPDARARVKVQMAANGYAWFPGMVDEAVCVSRELLRLSTKGKRK